MRCSICAYPGDPGVREPPGEAGRHPGPGDPGLGVGYGDVGRKALGETARGHSSRPGDCARAAKVRAACDKRFGGGS